MQNYYLNVKNVKVQDYTLKVCLFIKSKYFYLNETNKCLHQYMYLYSFKKMYFFIKKNFSLSIKVKF